MSTAVRLALVFGLGLVDGACVRDVLPGLVVGIRHRDPMLVGITLIFIALIVASGALCCLVLWALPAL